MSVPTSQQSSNKKATAKQWPDLSAYGLRLAVTKLPDGQSVYAVLGDAAALTKSDESLRTLGFSKSPTGNLYVRLASDGSLQVSVLKGVFPALTIRETLLTEIATSVPAAKNGARERREVAQLMNANPIGVNFKSETVYEGAAGRFVREIDGTMSHEKASPENFNRWLRYPDRASQAVIDDWRDKVAEGVVLSILNQNARYVGREFLNYVSRIYGKEVKRGPLEAADHLMMLQMHEAIEAASVRRIGNAKGFDEAFVIAVALNEGMPSQTTRSSVRMRLQQYSTPFPIAVAAQQVALIAQGNKIFEPTAGNGSLLSMVAQRDDVTIVANEIDGTRARRLGQLLNRERASVTVNDITTRSNEPCDVVISNPPFGALKEPVRFQSKHFPVQQDERLMVHRLDQQIVLKALEERAAGGTAVFVTAADHPLKTGGEPGKIAGSSVWFLKWLKDHYYVQDVVEIDGGLYQKFGTEYPVRIIVVGERKPQPSSEPVAETMRVIRSFEELRDWTNATSVQFRAAREARSVVEALATSTPTSGPESGRDDITVELPERAENALQAPYVAAAGIGESTSMIPRYLVAAQSVASERLKQRIGQGGSKAQVEDFVKNELRYDDLNVGELYSPEQLDALALAIVRISSGQGFLVGDQTGVGKGRVMAGLLRYAVLNGMKPVFLTEKANLFTDIWRDIKATGSEEIVRPFLLNADGVIRDIGTNQGIFRARQRDNERLLSWEQSGDSPQAILEDLGHNVTLATYSQFAIQGSRRNTLLPRLTDGQLLLLDESHNAAGDASNTGDCVRAAVRMARGVVYSSATFAKQAKNFGVYSELFRRPGSAEYVANIDQLGAIVHRGGEAVYESLSTMLVQDGAMVRRENDLTAISFDYVEASGQMRIDNEAVAVAFGRAVAAMSVFGGDVDKLVATVNKERKQLYKELPEEVRKGKRLGVSSANFGSRLYTLQRQLSLLLNARSAAERAVEVIRAGRKPVIAVEQTMQGLIEDLASGGLDDEDGDQNSQKAAGNELTWPNLQDVVRRVWDRMQMVRDAGPYGAPVMKTPEQLLAEGRQTVSRRDMQESDETAERIRRLSEFKAHVAELINLIPEVPAFPVDMIRLHLADNGYRMVEISGRKSQLQPIAGSPGRARLVERDDDRLSAVHAFNNGEAEAILLTRAGMTGLSLHASETFVDQRQRELIEVQIANNVAERMQMFGRVNRRGQVVGPINTTLGTGLPGDVRLLTMQAKKLAALSATTTSNRENKISTNEVPDLLNFIGEGVARRYIEDNREIAELVGLQDDDLKESEDPTFCVSRLLSRLCLIPDVDRQRAVIADLDAEFNSELAAFAERGENPFAMIEHDFKASVGEPQVLTGIEAESYDSEFDRPVYASLIEYEQIKEPLKYEEVVTRLDDNLRRATEASPPSLVPDKKVLQSAIRRMEQLDVFEPDEVAAALRFAYGINVKLGAAATLLNQMRDTALMDSDRHSTLRQALEDKQKNPVQVLHQKSEFLKWLRDLDRGCLAPGVTFNRVAAQSTEGEVQETRMLILDVKVPKDEQAHKLGRWELRVMPLGGAAHEIRSLTFQSLLTQHSTGHPLQFDLVPRRTLASLIQRESQQAVRHVKRTALTGNLFAASAFSVQLGTGTAGVFTSNKGERIRAVLMPEGSSPKKLLEVPVAFDDFTMVVPLFRLTRPERPTMVVSSDKQLADKNCLSVFIDGRQGAVKATISIRGREWMHVVKDAGLCEAIGEQANGRPGEAFAGTREFMRSAVFGEDDLPRVLSRLAQLGVRLYADASYRKGYNELVGKRAEAATKTVRHSGFDELRAA